MSSSIKCTNPSCQTFISVPEGAMQVICPSCNTWHFPTVDEGASPPSSSGMGSGYNIPESKNQSDLYATPSPIADQYVPPPVQQEAPKSPSAGNDNIGEREALAYLLLSSGKRLFLREGKNIIGRGNTDLIIDDKTVSRKHCVLEVNIKENDQLEFIIYDIGHLVGQPSTNGVFISGRSMRLQDYERISIGAETAITIGNVHVILKILNI